MTGYLQRPINESSRTLKDNHYFVQRGAISCKIIISDSFNPESDKSLSDLKK